MKRRAATLLLLLALCAAAFSTSHIARLYADAILGVGKTASREIAELQLERTIPLGSVTGRIDQIESARPANRTRQAFARGAGPRISVYERLLLRRQPLF